MTSRCRPSWTPLPWCDATCGWRRRVFHCRQPAPIRRNFRSPCTTDLSIPWLTPLEMRKVQLRFRLSGLEADIAAGRVRLCFGSKKLWRKQYDLKANGYASHHAWLDDWRAARSDEFFVLGSRDETAGCQLCVAFVNEGHYVNQFVRRFLPPARWRFSSPRFEPSRLRMRIIIRPRVVAPAIQSAPNATHCVATIAHLAFRLAGTILIPDCAPPQRLSPALFPKLSPAPIHSSGRSRP